MPGWDPEINGEIDDWSLNGPTRDKAGFTLEDRALLSASRMGTMLGLFNTDVPNPLPGTISRPAKGPFSFQIPEEMKIGLDNPQEITEKKRRLQNGLGLTWWGYAAWTSAESILIRTVNLYILAQGTGRSLLPVILSFRKYPTNSNML